MEKGKVKRKTFAVREDLIKRASIVAKQKGFSVYAFVNEIFQLTLEAEDMGIGLRSLIEERGQMKTARDANYILGLENLWYEMADIAYEKAKRKALRSWDEAGVWLAKRYLSEGIADPFLFFKRDLENFTWNASELDVKRDNGEVSIRIIGPRFSESYTLLLTRFLENALKTFGYDKITKDVSRGTIRIRAIGVGINV